MKVYRGTAAAARNYVESDRCRADDYYLAEGSGIAERLAVDADGRVVALPALSGDGYEAWVAGLDPETGEQRGRVRQDAHAVRFVEVVVNGPKSWSLAAELHPDVAAAYEAAQDRAARQILAWLGQHATTRVGPRGQQVAVPVQRLEAAVIRHYTSRAGDPHRHLHLQVNARVFAAGKWRGLDTVAFRDSIQALNGIGHAAVACDAAFRSALAAHGYTLNPDGEIEQLAPFVGAFSKRAAQIGVLLDRYEAAWRRAHPGQEPGAALRRAWDARAWAEDRPDKVVPRDGGELRERWLAELHALGYHDRDKPTRLTLPLTGALDRDAAAEDVIGRIGATRSAWNVADVRGEAEQLLARTGLIAEPAVRGELAEDLTARALELCVPLTGQPSPEHIRDVTSPQVLAVAAELGMRLADRGATEVTRAAPEPAAVDGLDAGQRAAVALLAGDAPLVVIEGAAGAGKTTTLAVTRELLAEQGRRLLVVTPTLKAAQAATAEVGAPAGSAAWLAWQHGWRWNQTGAWTREPSVPALAAVLHRGDLLLVDEAGMLDQDTANALVTIADQASARLALVGDRSQLPAVGRGGVLDAVLEAAQPDARLDLTTVHRFVHTVDGVTVPDTEYAELTLAMREGTDPAAVFDALHARGQIVLHASEIDRRDALAAQVAQARIAGGRPAVVVDTREHADTLNTAIRDQLVTLGAVDDRRGAITGEGQRIGVGDAIVTRRNDHEIDVANRESWIVTDAYPDGRLIVTHPDHRHRQLPAEYVRQFVELGYAATGYGAQGETTDTAHLVLTDKTTTAAAYVAMTRGREANTAHLVADNLEEAREQWVTAFRRDRADLGPAHAAAQAAREAAGYTPARPLTEVLADLREVWRQQAEAEHALDRLQPALAEAHAQAQAWTAHHAAVDRAQAAIQAATRDLDHATHQLHIVERQASQTRDRLATELRQAWELDRSAAQQAARRIDAGPGRFGLGRRHVQAAHAELEAWRQRWAPILGPDFTARRGGLVRFAAAHPANDHVAHRLDQHLDAQTDAAHPELVAARAARHSADQALRAARQQYHDAISYQPPGGYRAPRQDRLDEVQQHIQSAQQQLDAANTRLAQLGHEPAVSAQPNGWLDREHERWQDEHTAAALARLRAARAAHTRGLAPPSPHHAPGHQYGHSYGYHTGRDGPTIGR